VYEKASKLGASFLILLGLVITPWEMTVAANEATRTRELNENNILAIEKGGLQRAQRECI
jgi:hypothetical protein